MLADFCFDNTFSSSSPGIEVSTNSVLPRVGASESVDGLHVLSEAAHIIQTNSTSIGHKSGTAAGGPQHLAVVYENRAGDDAGDDHGSHDPAFFSPVPGSCAADATAPKDASQDVDHIDAVSTSCLC
jgi:hypothetical protein